MKKKNKIPIISDVTLRDGNHAVNHRLNEKVIKKYCELIDKTKVDIVEVGHGNGLGASSLASFWSTPIAMSLDWLCR